MSVDDGIVDPLCSNEACVNYGKHLFKKKLFLSKRSLSKVADFHEKLQRQIWFKSKAITV